MNRFPAERSSAGLASGYDDGVERSAGPTDGAGRGRSWWYFFVLRGVPRSLKAFLLFPLFLFRDVSSSHSMSPAVIGSSQSGATSTASERSVAGDRYIGRGCRQRHLEKSQLCNPYKVSEYGRVNAIRSFEQFLDRSLELTSKSFH